MSGCGPVIVTARFHDQFVTIHPPYSHPSTQIGNARSPPTGWMQAASTPAKFNKLEDVLVLAEVAAGASFQVMLQK